MRALLILFFSALCGSLFAQNDAEAGLASFYGDKFHNRLTASGERYNKDSFTAAHRDLPFGSLVKVTCKKTGKCVTVRINDRGPFKRGRVIDVSKAAAKELGIVRMGIADVSLEVIPQEPEESQPNLAAQEDRDTVFRVASDEEQEIVPPPAPVALAGWAVQIGAFRDPSNLQRSQSALQAQGFTETVTLPHDARGLQRLAVGPVATRQEAEELLNKMKRKGFNGYVIHIK